MVFFDYFVEAIILDRICLCLLLVVLILGGFGNVGELDHMCTSVILI